jgi:hypothetical protein
MRAAAIIISIIVAVVIAATISGALGVLIALAMVVYQVILDYGQSKTGREGRTVRGAYLTDIVRNGVFLVPLGLALINGLLPAVLATIVVYGVNLMMS